MDSNVFECSLETAPLLYTAAMAHNGADYYNYIKLWMNLHKNPRTKNDLFHGLVGPFIEIHAEKFLLRVLEEDGLVVQNGQTWQLAEKVKNRSFLKFVGATEQQKQLRAMAAASTANAIAAACDASSNTGSATLFLSKHQKNQYDKLVSDLKALLTQSLDWHETQNSSHEFEISMLYRISNPT